MEIQDCLPSVGRKDAPATWWRGLLQREGPWHSSPSPTQSNTFLHFPGTRNLVPESSPQRRGFPRKFNRQVQARWREVGSHLRQHLVPRGEGPNVEGPAWWCCWLLGGRSETLWGPGCGTRGIAVATAGHPLGPESTGRHSPVFCGFSLGLFSSSLGERTTAVTKRPPYTFSQLKGTGLYLAEARLCLLAMGAFHMVSSEKVS